jgi:FkbM family methyltransferase
MVRLASLFRLILFIVISSILLWNLEKIFQSSKTTNLYISPNVHIVNPDDPSLNRNFSCIKTKIILGLFQTTLCLHSEGDTISNGVRVSHIWEESEVIRLVNILIRYPHLDMIDIGANIGGFTMFTAGSLRRFTLAIDCYLPNIERIARAVQLESIHNHVVLIQNALYFKSGENLKIEDDDPSGIRLSNDTYKKTKTGYFIAKSIEFDDLLPILIRRGVRSALIKIDIETSESYMCQTGSKIFDQIDIQFIQMEWHSWRINHQIRYQFIIDFFKQRQYIPTDNDCKELQISQWLTDWPGNVFWIKKIYFINQTFC